MLVRPWLALLLLFALGGCLGALEPGSVAPGDIPDPTTLARTGRPNDWLICPQARCRAETSLKAEIYAVPPDELFALWQAVLQEEPRVTVIATDPPRRLVRRRTARRSSASSTPP